MAARLAAIGLRSDWDFIFHLPLRYEDETVVVPIDALSEGGESQIEATVTAADVVFRGRRQLHVTVQDASGTLVLRFLHFYPSQLKQLALGQRIRAFGASRGGLAGMEMVHPRVRSVREGEALPNALTPIYPTTAAVPQGWLRRRIARALRDVELRDLLPDSLRERFNLEPLRPALERLHPPPPAADAPALAERTDPAWQRLNFDELVAQQIALRLARAARQKRSSPALRPDGLTGRLLAALPFALTAAQRRVWAEI
ncbi:MAG TPA: ATP-dependent DNA helicase RecG, partial [Burkholderiaceae bacterium]|nr:ATP-dependent DNA helicase RecG [Burkholderiaceae bacterium]